MSRKVYSIPAVGVDGTHVSINAVMSEEQAQLMASIGRWTLLAEQSAEVVALLDVDMVALAEVEAESERIMGRTAH